MSKVRLMSFLTVVVLGTVPAVVRAAPDLGGVKALGHAVTVAEDHRDAAAPAIATALGHSDRRLRAQAVRALGRIGVRAEAPRVIALASDPDAGVRAEVAFALGLLGGDSAYETLTARLAAGGEAAPEVRREIHLALGRTGGEGALPLLGEGLRDDQALARAGAAQGLGLLMMRLEATVVVPASALGSLLDLAAGSGPEAVPAAMALARFKGTMDDTLSERLVAVFAGAKTLDAAGFLARAVGRLKSEPARLALEARLGGADGADQSGLRVEILRALGAFAPGGAVVPALLAGLRDSQAQVRVQALQSLGRFGVDGVSVAPQVSGFYAREPSLWVRAEAVAAVTALDAAEGRRLIEGILADRAAPELLLAAALRSAGGLGGVEALAILSRFADDSRIAVASAAVEGLAGLTDDVLKAGAFDVIRRAIDRHDVAITGMAADLAARVGWRELAPALAAAYRSFTRPDDLEGKTAVLGALGRIGGESELPLIRAALQDDERAVALAAAAAWQSLTGEDVSALVPATSRINTVTPSAAALRRAVRARLVFRTDRGSFVMRMRDEAPLTVHNIVSLARRGFYNGRTMHRIVPHFVAQGGDPRGDGWGGPGWLIRDEVSGRSHLRGTVGIATAGKDTGGCQFFVNHGPNLHLDGNYTVFAEVVRGMDVVDALEAGDLIRSVAVLD